MIDVKKLDIPDLLYKAYEYEKMKARAEKTYKYNVDAYNNYYLKGNICCFQAKRAEFRALQAGSILDYSLDKIYDDLENTDKLDKHLKQYEFIPNWNNKNVSNIKNWRLLTHPKTKQKYLIYGEYNKLFHYSGFIKDIPFNSLNEFFRQGYNIKYVTEKVL